jgi:alpha-N-arabinofuranosidase
MQWESDLIGYDTLTSYGSPSYYAQVMFSNHVGDQILDARLDGAALRFFYSVTRASRDGKLYLKMVNATASPRTLTIRLNGVSQVSKNGKIISMSASTTQSTNTVLDPKKIVPREGTIRNAATQFSYTLPPYSIQVVELEAH